MKGKFIAIIAAAIVLTVFNATSRPIRTQEQKAFDTWLESMEESLRSGSNDSNSSAPISIKIRSDSSKRKFAWELSTSEGGERTEQVLRILRLAREGDVFSRDSGDSGEVELNVTQGEKSFSTRLSEDLISRNPQAGNLVKLFELFASSKNFGALGGSV